MPQRRSNKDCLFWGRVQSRTQRWPSNQSLSSKSSTKSSGLCRFLAPHRGVPNPFSVRVKVREGRFGEITQILGWYEYINDVILDHLDDEIKSTNKSGVWRYLISFKNLLRAIENIGIVSVYGIRYLTTGNVTQQNFIKWGIRVFPILCNNTNLWSVNDDDPCKVCATRHSHLGIP